MTDSTYTPTDRLKPVTDDVWIVDSGPLKVMGVLPLPVRMSVLRLKDGGLLLHSPTRFTPGLLAQLREIGTPRHLVAPNSAHWTMMQDWQKALPDATTWGAPGLRDRRQVKASGLRLDHDLGVPEAAGWPAELEQVDVPGIGGFHEVCLFHVPSRTLLMTDLIQNLEPEKMPAAARPLLSVAGNLAPDGRAPGYLRAVVRMKGSPAREAARRLVALAPERVIFAHGAWFESDGSARLTRALDWLLHERGAPEAR